MKTNIIEINADTLQRALESSSINLFNNHNRIDSLNIFPVPDGDTGSNMNSTLKNTVEKLSEKKYLKVGEFLKDFSKEMLLNARGNSGVILSQIFKGFFEAWKDEEKINLKNVLKGFEQAKKFAYQSVLKPIEGTILTVIREVYENLEKEMNKNAPDLIHVFKSVVEFARKSVDNTINLLPVLKQANVIDSGGEGLFVILNGIYLSLIGEDVKINKDIEQQRAFIKDSSEIYDGEFGYCTETIIELNKPEKLDKKSLNTKLSKIGNSLVLVQDEEILKIHIHVLKPGEALNILQKYGEFIKIKSENMTIQANETKDKIDQEERNIPDVKSASSIISCNEGAGFINSMYEHGCNIVINSVNPSIKDFLENIEKVNSDSVIILPNNKNSILGAQQAAKLSKKNVYVIPSKSQIESITAIINFSNELELEDNVEEIQFALKNIVVGGISQAAKDSKMDGINIKKNYFLEMLGGKIISTNKDLTKGTISLIKEMMKRKKDPEIIIIYYGEDSSITEIEEIEKFIEKNYDLEIEIKPGDQPLYNFLISIE